MGSANHKGLTVGGSLLLSRKFRTSNSWPHISPFSPTWSATANQDAESQLTQLDPTLEPAIGEAFLSGKKLLKKKVF